VDEAGRVSLGELRDKARHIRHAAEGPDHERRQRRLHAERFVRTWTDDEGAGCGQWRTDAAQQARIVAGLRFHHEAVFADAKATGRRERLEAYALDGLERALTHDGDDHHDEHPDQGGDDGGDGGDTRKPKTKRRRRPSGADAKIILRVDYQALVRGHTLPGETCEITGIGPVSVDAARHWILDGAFVAAVLTHGTDLTKAVHLGRHPTALQTTALQWIAPTCSVEGCNNTIRLEKDHTTDWATTHHTVLWALDHLCSHHHALKTHHGYRLAPGTGTRPMLPPPEDTTGTRAEATTPASGPAPPPAAPASTEPGGTGPPAHQTPSGPSGPRPGADSSPPAAAARRARSGQGGLFDTA
jgi:hypothetical protein